MSRIAKNLMDVTSWQDTHATVALAVGTIYLPIPREGYTLTSKFFHAVVFCAQIDLLAEQSGRAACIEADVWGMCFCDETPLGTHRRFPGIR
jgi:hypothetical protein